MPASNKALPGKFDFSSPVASGLLAGWAINEGGGVLRSQGILPSVDLPLTANGVWGVGIEGRGLISNVNDQGAWTTTPAGLRIQAGTLAWRGVFSAGPSNSAQFGGITYTNADSAPYGAMVFTNQGGLGAFFNRGGAYASISSSISIVAGLSYTLVATWNASATAGWTPTFYVNGVPFTSSSSTGLISYATTSQVFVGAGGYALSRNNNCIVYGQRIWNRVLSFTEVMSITHGWYDIRQPRVRPATVYVPTVATFYFPRSTFVRPTWPSKAAMQYP